MTRSRARIVAAAIILVPLLAYPLVAAGGARFPSTDDCVRLASEGETGELDLVFGRRDTVAEAEALLEQVRGVGYVDASYRKTDASAGRCCTTASSRTSRGQAPRSRRTGPGSKRGSSSSRRADRTRFRDPPVP